jgi:hypothetical protein
MCGLDLTSDPGIPLLRASLDVLPAEDKVIPVDSTSFEDCHL